MCLLPAAICSAVMPSFRLASISTPMSKIRCVITVRLLAAAECNTRVPSRDTFSIEAPYVIKAAATSSFLARCNAVFPSKSRDSISAPHCSSNSTMPFCLPMTATCKGVLLCQSRASILAPFSNNVLTIDSRPSTAARCNTVLPSLSRASMSDPYFSINPMITPRLCAIAACKGVLLCQSRAFTEAPFSSNNLSIDSRPSSAAKDNAVFPSLSSNSKSTFLLSKVRTTASCSKTIPRCKAVFLLEFC